LNEASRTRADWLLLAGFCAFLFFFGLNYFGLIGADEPRYAQVAREMLARHDWITPTLDGKPWLEKPVLYYWQAMLVYRVFGVSDWAARLPSALDATLMIVTLYWFLLRFRRGAHLDGALAAASCAAVIGYARAASPDMPLTAALTLSLLAWYAWHETGAKVYLAVSYLFVALGTLAKGPVAPLLVVAIVVIFASAQRQYELIRRSLWLPGLLIFCLTALPWYVLVQLRNPEFFRVFILQHNLARFGTNLYHHPQPVWFYLPVILLALVPWTVFVMVAAYDTARAWWSGRSSSPQSQDDLSVFLLIWLLLPVLFFSLSQSKLPGYIVPSVPAGALLFAGYLHRRMSGQQSVSRLSLLFHSVVAAAPLVPAFMIQYILVQHRFPWGRGAAVAIAIALAVATGIALTLLRTSGLLLLRFVTLVPVVLTVAAILRIGGPTLDATLSARPLAKELSGIDTKNLPLALLGVSRETDYGLNFYRDQTSAHYDEGQIPPGEHLLVAPEGAALQIAKFTPDRRVSHLGNFAAQHLDYYWVSAPGMMAGMHH